MWSEAYIWLKGLWLLKCFRFIGFMQMTLNLKNNPNMSILSKSIVEYSFSNAGCTFHKVCSIQWKKRFPNFSFKERQPLCISIGYFFFQQLISLLLCFVLSKFFYDRDMKAQRAHVYFTDVWAHHTAAFMPRLCVSFLPIVCARAQWKMKKSRLFFSASLFIIKYFQFGQYILVPCTWSLVTSVGFLNIIRQISNVRRTYW